MRPLVAFAIGLSLLSLAGHADAQVASSQADDVAASREGLLADAQAASDAGDHLHALDLARRAASLGSDASLRLFVARQAYAMGLLDEAYGASARCRSEIRNASESSVAAACDAMRDELAPRLGRVVVRVDPHQEAGLVVRVAGHVLPDALYNAPDRVTPGHVIVEWQRGEGPVERRDIEVSEGQEVAIETGETSAPVAVSTTQIQVAINGPPTILLPAAPIPLPPVLGGPMPQPRRSPLVGPLALIATGVAVAASSTSFLMTSSSTSQSAAGCPSCQSERDSAATHGTIGWALLAAGTTFVTAGGIWAAAASHAARTPPIYSAFVSPARDGAMVGVTGTF